MLNSASELPMLACHQNRVAQTPLYNSASQTLYCQEQGHNLMAANASTMQQEIFNCDFNPSAVSSKCSSSYSSPFSPQPHASNLWRSTTPDLQHSRGVSSQLNYGNTRSERNVTNESTVDMSGGDGSHLQSSISSIPSESDMASRMFHSSQGTGQESCQNSGAHSSLKGFSYSSGGNNGAFRKRRLRSVEDREYQSEECILDDLEKCSKRSRVAQVHNLSEKRRRDRINEKMKTLQELIPNCNKADKASILEEAIRYLKLLQLQAQILSIQIMAAYSRVPNLLTYSPIGMDMGLGMAMGMGMGMGMVDMGGIAVHASASDQVIPKLKGSPTIAPTSGIVLVRPNGMGMVGMGGTMLSSSIASTADVEMVGMGDTMISSIIAPTYGTTGLSSTIAPTSSTMLVNPPGMGMVGMGGTRNRAPTSDRIVPTIRGSSTISPTSGTTLDSPQQIYGTEMASMGGTMVKSTISDRVVPTLRASSIIPPSSGTVPVSPREDIYVPSWS